MGVSVESGGGRGRKLDADVNLVPFIDLLSVTITFLMATATWLSVAALQVDQAVSESPSDAPEGPPALRVSVETEGVRVGRGELAVVPHIEGAPDWAAVDAILDADRAAFPAEQGVVISGMDGVAYEHVIEALDRTRARGYDNALLGSSGR